MEVRFKDPEKQALVERLVACMEAGHKVVLFPPKFEEWDSTTPQRYKPDPDAIRCVTCEGLPESFKRSPESELPIRVDAKTRRRLNL